MKLTIHQKSIYLMILNDTMILRSIGKSIQSKSRLRNFKIHLFKLIEMLADKIDNGTLTEKNITESITSLKEGFSISFGQAQKPINVILKYHFYLSKNKNALIKNMLNCPIDSLVLKDLGIYGLTLTKLDKEKYMFIEGEIEKRSRPKIQFDNKWDEKHLRDEGLL